MDYTNVISQFHYTLDSFLKIKKTTAPIWKSKQDFNPRGQVVWKDSAMG